MLEFFRRYEKVLFIFITTVIVISFSFFGTYSAFSQKEGSDSVAFVALGGAKIYSSQLRDLETLLQGDVLDEYFTNSGTAFNDGVITKDILENGLGLSIMLPYVDVIKSDLNLRLQKEKRFKSYVNPNVSFINAEQVWSYFAPDIKYHLNTLKAQEDSSSKEALDGRINLYLAQRKFPAQYLQQVLRFQEKEYNPQAGDESLMYQDLSLFGYHNAQDWFGEKFIKLVSEFIINTAQVAKRAGYDVSRDEVKQTILKNLENSFNERSRSPSFPYTNFEEYYNRELQRLGMDERRVIDAWTYVVLFRRYYQENADSLLVSPLPFTEFAKNINKFAELEIYELPKELNFNTLKDGEKFEIYLKAISDSNSRKNGFLPIPPENILAVSEIKKTHPELVEREFRLKHSMLDKKQLASRVGVKKTWQWELDSENFKKLQSVFPDLSHDKGGTLDERTVILDKLDPATRHRVDTFARNLIIDEHPEWIEETINTLPTKEEIVYLRERGGEFPFPGITNRQGFINLLTASSVGKNPELLSYTQDNQNYYNIELLDLPKEEILVTYKKALEDGTLDALFDKTLQSYYVRMGVEKPQLFMRDGKRREFREIKDQVEESYFQDYRISLSREFAKEKGYYSSPGKPSEGALASIRLVPYLKDVKTALISGSDNAGKFFQDNGTPFKLEKRKERVIAKSAGNLTQEALKIEKDGWSNVTYSDTSGVYFYKVLDKGEGDFKPYLRDKVYQERELIGRELKKDLTKILLSEMQKENAIVMDGEKKVAGE